VSLIVDEILNADPHLATAERVASVAIGLVLASAATQPRPNPLLGLLAITVGGFLTYRGAVGYCPLKAALAHEPLIQVAGPTEA
jgi:uncharacterized membrane protein